VWLTNDAALPGRILSAGFGDAPATPAAPTAVMAAAAAVAPAAAINDLNLDMATS
jgi:hypothetical protein